MTKNLVVVTDSNLPGDSVIDTILSEAGFVVRRADCSSSHDVRREARGAVALIVQWATVDSAALDALPDCRFISRLGIGVDMIDVDAAAKRGIAVANTPRYCVEEVSAHTIALVLQATRQLRAHDAAVRAGHWSVTEPKHPSLRPSSTTVAVIGYGRIGRQTANHLSALGFRVVVHDPYVNDSIIAADGHDALPLNEALLAAHIVSLHAPLNQSTKHLIDSHALDLMRTGSYLVNTCRGGLVNEAALVQSLRGGHLAGAALDVFESEPIQPDNPLLSLPEVALSPHTAWYSPDSMVDLPREAAENVVDFLSGQHVTSIINPTYESHGRSR